MIVLRLKFGGSSEILPVNCGGTTRYLPDCWYTFHPLCPVHSLKLPYRVVPPKFTQFRVAPPKFTGRIADDPPIQSQRN